MNYVHWCSQCQNMTLIYHPWRGGQWWVIIFWGRGTRVMTPIHHLRMSHHSNAHESWTLMHPVSKHEDHLSPMERRQWWVIIFWGGGPASWRPFIIWGWVIILTLMNHVHWCTQCQNMTLIYHPWRGGNDESSFSGGGGPASWRPFIIWGWVIILMLIDHVHWFTQCQNMTLIYHPWRGGNDESSFYGGGPQTWRSFTTLQWVIILMTLNVKYGANIQRHSIIFWTSHSNVCIIKE